MMKKRRSSFLAIAASLIIFLNACGPRAGIASIQIDTVSPAVYLDEGDKVILSNCDGALEYSTTLGLEKPIQKSIKVESIATNHNGLEYNIPAEIGLELETKVEDTYQKIYESIRQRLETVIMKVAPGKKTIYTIQWEKWVYYSNINFVRGDVVYQVAYDYELLLPNPKVIYLEESPCSTPIVTPISTILSPSTSVTNSPTSTLVATSPPATRTKHPKDTKTPLMPTTYP